MPNFTITRLAVSPGDDYGCTQFQTNQHVGDVATLNNPFSPLDGDIVWYLDADPGYVVNLGDFDIPNTTPTAVAQTSTYRTFEGAGLPSVVNGVVMEQITQTRIKITIFLHPEFSHGITGPIFTMPGNDIDVNIEIDGCAEIKNHEARLGITSPEGQEGAKETVTLARLNQTTLLEETGDDGKKNISGPLSVSEQDSKLFDYKVEAKEGYEFKSPPTLRISTDDYYATSSVTTNSLGKIISTTFEIYKTI